MKSKFNARIITPVFALGVLLGLALLATLGRSEDPRPPNPPPRPPQRGPGSIKAGSNIKGSASDLDPPIVVKAYLNGVRIATDSTSSQGVNSFCIPTSDAEPGDSIEIRATDSFGNQTTESVDVVPCQ
jgi:hypothetical protein